MRLLNKILFHTYRPLLQKYLSRDREYSYNGINLTVRTGVFHPGYFLSTGWLLSEMESLDLKYKSLLELGCGSGLLSIVAAKQGAIVTASDISHAAVSCTQENAKRNRVPIKVIQSDMFSSLGPAVYDIILVNPPFYRGKPRSTEARAWYCGENLDYFKVFFKQLKGHIHPGSRVWMILSENCELDAIKQIAGQNHFDMALHKTFKHWLEKNFIFEIKGTTRLNG